MKTPMKLSEAEAAGLSPGIRDLVIALNEAGFDTTDSGDGSNWKEGMLCALPYRHVAILVPHGESAFDHACEVREWMNASKWAGEFVVDAADPMDGHPDVVLVEDVRHGEICDRVGYVPPTMEELTGGSP